MIPFNPRPACFMFLMLAMAAPAFDALPQEPEALPAGLPIALAEPANTSGTSVAVTQTADGGANVAVTVTKPCVDIPMSVVGPDGVAFKVVVPCKDPGTVGSAAQHAIGNWDGMAFLASLVAMLTALMRFLKMTPVEGYLEARDLKWVKPAASAFAGAIIGAIGAFELGTPVMVGFVGGFMSGLTAVGSHEMLNPRKPAAAPVAPPAPAAPPAPPTPSA